MANIMYFEDLDDSPFPIMNYSVNNLSYRLTHDISLDNFQDENLEQQYELNNIYKSTPDSAESTINFIKDLYTANNRTRGSSRTSLTSQSDTESLKSSQSYTDIVKTPENAKNGYTHGKNDSLSIKDLGVDKISPEMVHMDMMNFEKRKEKKSESRRECKRLDSQEIADSAWSNYANYTKKALEDSVFIENVAASRPDHLYGSTTTTKRRYSRKPRKLPEIPTTAPHHIPAAISPSYPRASSPMSMSTCSERSIADEILEVENVEDEGQQLPDPFFKPEEYYFEQEKSRNEDILREQRLHDDFDLEFDTTSVETRAFLSSSNPYLVEDSSPEKKPKKSGGLGRQHKKDSVESNGSVPRSSTSNSFHGLEDYESTHRGIHKFIPRHEDEMHIEIGDPIYVEVEADDLWCEGYNLRTGKKGIFPSVYATDLSFLEEEENEGDRTVRYMLRFLGSVEVSYHKGNDVLCQAIHKVAMTRRMTLNTAPPPSCRLDISKYGIKMVDKSKGKNKATTPTKNGSSIKSKLAKLLSKEQPNSHDHFFSLKNVSFCGFHPKNERYFAFITKHPVEMRFACHVFLGEDSTKPVSDAIGKAFKKFYQEYMAFSHPTEDIYLE